MALASHPEIRKLEEILSNHKVEVRILNNVYLAGNENYPAVAFNLGNQSFKLYVEDEYGDFQINNPLLHLCLVLRELENYQYESDYLSWCNTQLLEPSNSIVSEYYKNLNSLYFNIEKELGKIDSQISNFDFELNAGPAQELRSFK